MHALHPFLLAAAPLLAFPWLASATPLPMDAREVAGMLNAYSNANQVERCKPYMRRIRERLDDHVIGEANGGPHLSLALGLHPSTLASASVAHCAPPHLATLQLAPPHSAPPYSPHLQLAPPGSAPRHSAPRLGSWSFHAEAAAQHPDPGSQAAGFRAGPQQPYGAPQDVADNELELSQAKTQVERLFHWPTITQVTGGLVRNPNSGQRYFASESQRNSLLDYIRARLKHDLSLQGKDPSLVRSIQWWDAAKWPHQNPDYGPLATLYKLASTRGKPAEHLSTLAERKQRIFRMGDYTVELMRRQKHGEDTPWLVFSVMARTDRPSMLYKGIYLGDLGVPTALLSQF